MIAHMEKDEDTSSVPRQISSKVTPLKESLPSPTAVERSGSTTTETQSPTTPISRLTGASREPSPAKAPRTIVVRGFSPSIPIPQAISGSVKDAASDMIPKAESPNNPKPIIPIVKKPIFTMGSSSEEGSSLKNTLAGSRPSSLLSRKNKQAPFSTNIVTRTIEDETAVDSDTDYIDENAIDDDGDSSEWEDFNEDSSESSIDDKFFQRVDSKANLTSRPSLITLMLAQNDRSRTLDNHASQSTSAIPQSRIAPNSPSLDASPNDSNEAPLRMKDLNPHTLKPIHEIPRSSAQPIVSHTDRVQGQAALSPHTTRRNMLANELTTSLRKHLLWEQQQKSLTANAVLKRRHTSHDGANLKQNPVKSCINTSEDVNASSWNPYFSNAAGNGYHSKGW